MIINKKYLHLIPTLRYGGAESFLLRLVDNLEGIHLIVVLLDSSKDEIRIKELQKKNVSYLNLSLRRITFKKIKIFFKYIFELDREDRIFSWLYIADLLASFLKLVFRIKAPLIWNVRCTLVQKKDYSLFSYFSYIICLKLFRNIPRKIVFNSKKAMDQYLLQGYPSKKSIVIYNGFERLIGENPQKLKKEFLNLICVARYHPQKNHSLLIKTLFHFKKKYKKKFVLHLVGENIEINNKELTNLLKSNQIFEDVKLYGTISPKEVHKLFAMSDISLLFSSFGESFPNVLAESMLYGTIPIATAVGDAEYIVSNFGEIIPLDISSKEISEIILRYANLKIYSSDIWNKKVKSCIDFSSNRFNIKNIASQFHDL
jgi:glycosyltransferase involved in cell wall biosynthesis